MVPAEEGIVSQINRASGSTVPTGFSNTIYRFNPLSDERWDRFLASHPNASVFHSSAWIDALRRTYGYEPVVFTTSPPDAELRNAVLCSQVRSWLTGPRMVSLPFSDHCDVLVETEADLALICGALGEELKQEQLRYLELRPVRPFPALSKDFNSGAKYCLHLLDLTPNLGSLFAGFHKSSTQRKILRAEREGLAYEEGTSEVLLNDFMRLWLFTRRRHAVPPQPTHWFRNIINCFGERVKIRLARKGREPIAAMITLQCRDTLVYKYGCSDKQFHNLGGMHLLFWRAIQEAKRRELNVFDFGRSDWTNPGLITFKDRWGAKRSELAYFVMRTPGRQRISSGALIGERVIPYLPNALFRSLGKVMYRHFG